MSDADAYDFYPCLVDDAPASIYVNLRFADTGPLVGATTRYALVATMRDPGPHGIGTADEADVLNAFEEAAIAAGRLHGLVYVGRLRTRGIWEITLYGPAGHVDALLDAAREPLAGRPLQARTDADADWTYYRELLLPDAERRQWMDDRRLVQILRDQGDGLRTPRRVDHRVTFKTAGERDAFVAAAQREGFAVEDTSQAEAGERPFQARVSRTDPIELDHIHDVVMILVDAASSHGGRYEGWTSAIEA